MSVKTFISFVVMLLALVLVPMMVQAERPSIEDSFNWSGLKWDVWTPAGYLDAGEIAYGDHNYLEITTDSYDQGSTYWWGAIHYVKSSSLSKNYQSGWAEFFDSGSEGGPWVFFEEFTGGDNKERQRVMMGSLGDNHILSTRVMRGTGTDLEIVPGTVWTITWARTAGVKTAWLQRNPDGTLNYEFAGKSGICSIGDGAGSFETMTMESIERFSVASSGAPGSTAVFIDAGLHANN